MKEAKHLFSHTIGNKIQHMYDFSVSHSSGYFSTTILGFDDVIDLMDRKFINKKKL